VVASRVQGNDIRQNPRTRVRHDAFFSLRGVHSLRPSSRMMRSVVARPNFRTSSRLTHPADSIVFMEGPVGSGPMFAECCDMSSYPGDRATILAKMAAAYPAEGGFPAGYHPNRPLKRAKTDPNFWVMENGIVHEDGTMMPVQRMGVACTGDAAGLCSPFDRTGCADGAEPVMLEPNSCRWRAKILPSVRGGESRSISHRSSALHCLDQGAHRDGVQDVGGIFGESKSIHPKKPICGISLDPVERRQNEILRFA